jgi:hypothetical protein
MVENASTSLVATGACAVKDLLEITAQSETTAIQILASMEELVKSLRMEISQIPISRACALKTSLE